ncbi:MAG TPA: 3-oxoadipate CoA-transferase [Rhodospirillaceae bacterium]|nr:3-oxoadipate CoA-transferase [Rhodospirillaceae bacterium]HAT35194.1 3-oxoadipate CoA-transferase [Rhodospirillaceae bacterium]
MKNKKANDIASALDAVKDGDLVLFGGFGTGGVPIALIEGLTQKGLKDLTIVSNNAGAGHNTIATLLETGAVRKVICTFPYSRGSVVFNELYDSGKIELELVPQGTLAERMRNAGSGLGGFLTPTALGTEIAEGKPHIEVDGKTYVLEKPLHADVALIKADKVDPRGNLTYRLAARNFNPVMAMAAKHTVAQVSEEVPLGDLDPATVHTPGVYVDTYVIDKGARIE